MNKTEILHRFREYLTKNGFGPGDKLPGEMELAERFGISRGDIREVLMHFSHLGLLSRIKKRGTFICEVPYANLQNDMILCFQLAQIPYNDLLEARIALELSVAPLLIKRINREHTEILQGLIDEMKQSIDDPVRADALDREFHLQLLAVSGNSVLKLYSNVLYTIFRQEFRKDYQTARWIKRSLDDHQQILNAITSGDEEKVRQLISSHLKPGQNEN
ncbi:MAG: FadR family transcriptional regulator [Lentisphaeria bacterium]|nr:FadR family transcriptional regulator [Lentisphaeria bacterium]